MDIRKQIGEELLLFDGAMGTMLQKYGMKAGQNPEALNLEDPELLSRIHREYVEAGCTIHHDKYIRRQCLQIAGDRLLGHGSDHCGS